MGRSNGEPPRGALSQALNTERRVLSDIVAIASDDVVRSGDPRIEGTRIAVLDVKRRVIDASENPHVVAGEYGVSMADLFRALAYYHDHREEFRDREHETAAARREGERRTRELADEGETVERAD
jgi:uncharacterized protein (DUF433 family)